MVLLLAVELNGGDALQDAVVCQVNVPLLEGSCDGRAGRYQHGAPTTHALDAECPTARVQGLAKTRLGDQGGGGTLRATGVGRDGAATEGGRQGGRGGLHRSGPHLQLGLQARSLAQERGHHVFCDGELIWDPRAAAEQAWVDTIEVLVPKEAVLCPVLGHVLWGDGGGTSGRGRMPLRDREAWSCGRGRRKTTDTREDSKPPASPLVAGGAQGDVSQEAARGRARPASDSCLRFTPPVPSRGCDSNPGLLHAPRVPPARDHLALPRSIRDAPPRTGDDRLVGRENFLNVLQSLPRPFAVHQTAEFQPQCPRS